LFKVDPIPSTVLAQAALFLSLQEAKTSGGTGGVWSSLAFRRFGDISEKVYKFDDREVKIRHLSTGIEVVIEGETHSVNPTLVSETELITRFDTSRTSATIIPVGLRLHIFTSGKHFQVTQSPSEIDVDASAGAASSDRLTSPMPARVLEVRVKEGESVISGQVVCVLESMKMEINVRAGRDGIVGSVGVEKGMVVEEGQVLVVLKE
jgi:3-methylcrotonyl-CoA carboxylase alpha subunit